MARRIWITDAATGLGNGTTLTARGKTATGTLSMAVLVCLVACIHTTRVHAQPIPDESGFSGFLGAGAGILDYESNLIAGTGWIDVGDPSIGSLATGPASSSTGLPVFNVGLNYTFASTRTQISLGTVLEDVVRLDYSSPLALRQRLPDESILSAGFVFMPLVTEVWQDPYVTDEARNRTDRTSAGVCLIYDRILGSNLQVRYSLRNIGIDDERSGASLDLTPAERDLLLRDGTDHAIELNYTFDFLLRHRIFPSVTYHNQDRDGAAMKRTGVDLQATYFYFGDPFTVILNGLVGRAEHDAVNPIYGELQQDNRYVVNAQLFYRKPFGLPKDFSLFVGGSYFVEDTNIDFYDTRGTTFNVGILFNFQ